MKVAKAHDLPPGRGRVAECDGHSIALFNIGGTFYAIDRCCAHQGGPLGAGFVEGTVVTCPWHLWQYDVTTGRGVRPRFTGVRKYEVRVVGDDIEVALPPPRGK